MMINSLRLSGNRGEVAGTHALAVKPSVYLLEPKGVAVLVDSDMIVTRKLDDLVDRALDGQIVVFPDHHSKHDRWFAEWEELFELAAEPRRQVYVNAREDCIERAGRHGERRLRGETRRPARPRRPAPADPLISTLS